ncbi:hypothetical protein VIGAN_02130700 [Vigna angularis var. angularis]|uniref:Uncharacterized protein n=1 Tax=Vigna angularis var. angularis TaxID=157739 RepID=A0A0S3RDX0_PHAAN|nr:hypothetical protein VIGAN_02130700 [Vigna angularis var. angularis]
MDSNRTPVNIKVRKLFHNDLFAARILKTGVWDRQGMGGSIMDKAWVKNGKSYGVSNIKCLKPVIPDVWGTSYLYPRLMAQPGLEHHRPSLNQSIVEMKAKT